jgi:hypothetical protein
VQRTAKKMRQVLSVLKHRLVGEGPFLEQADLMNDKGLLSHDLRDADRTVAGKIALAVFVQRTAKRMRQVLSVLKHRLVGEGPFLEQANLMNDKGLLSHAAVTTRVAQLHLIEALKQCGRALDAV